MIKLFKWLSRGDRLTIEKSVSGDWMVKRGFKVLYVGTKDECQLYIGLENAA